MDPERERIQADLRGLIAGDVLCDDLYLQLYASDASLYEIQPLGIVLPRSTRDVVACVQYAAENKIPVHARGAGTGLAGESLGRGLIVDFSKYMRRILRTEGDRVRVQPGVVHAKLNEHLAMHGRIFGPDPAMSRVTTMGSVIAIDASGSHWLQYGSTRRHIISLQVVLADGELMEVGIESLTHPPPVEGLSRQHELVTRLAELLKQEAPLIEQHRPASLVNRCGYHVWDVLSDGQLDLGRLICGSEGTLALVTEATLATDPLPQHRGLAVLLFDNLDGAAQAVQDVLKFGPSACDLLDRRHLSLARETDVRYHLMIPAEAEALLLVEHCGDEMLEVRRRLAQTIDVVRTRRRLAFDTRQALDREEMDLYWQLAYRVVPTLHRLKGSARPLPFVEDMAVPPAYLPDFLVRMQNVLKRHQVTASLYGHAGHGQLHLRPFLDLSNPEDMRKIEPLAADLYQEVIDVGGTISGEHADGLCRTQFIRRQYGELYRVFRGVKNIFDPHNILNPGKVISDELDLMTRDLRPLPIIEQPATAMQVVPASTNGNGSAALNLLLSWNSEQMANAAARCNGCGACRSQSPDVRMCPVFRFAPREEASPRAKANLMRAIVDGHLEPGAMARDDFKAVADLCVNCHQCRLECPANVDIPKLMVEAKGVYVATNGLRPSDWLLTRWDVFGTVGNVFGPLANWAIGNRQARWLLEKLLGIAQARKLPRFAPRTFLRRASRMRLTRPTRRSGPKVVYFVDTYATYHDVQLAEALVAVLEHNGVAVYVPPQQRPSGMAMISMGALDAARKVATTNVALLAECVRQGYHIVSSEPAAALCLTHEYLNLLDDDDSRLVAENSSEACTYLWRLHREGSLKLDFKPVETIVGYHLPCHLKALSVGSPGENLMRLIPGLTVRRVERGCSGMAGTFGLKRENFRNSLRAGRGLIFALREPSIQCGTTECSTCKMQMEQGAPKATIHPLKLLALSYGLMPEVASLLTAKPEELVVT